MAENNIPQNRQDDELSVEELEQAAGGDGDTNSGCPVTNNTNCPCSDTSRPVI